MNRQYLRRKKTTGEERKKKQRVSRTRSKNKDEGTMVSVEEDNHSKIAPVSTHGRILDKDKVSNFVDRTLQKGVKGVIAEFRSMKRMNDFSKMTAFVAANQMGKNRYKDVGCLDNARVELRATPTHYIHANYVSTPANPRRFICTQGPLPATVADFWTMVIQERSAAIVMLCDFFENNVNKCAQYLPKNVGETMTFADIQVTATEIGPVKFRVETRTKILRTKIEVVQNGMRHSCTHFHWQDWPDRGVPDVDLAPVELLSTLSKLSLETPIIIHCSAGVGRTGSIVLIDIVIEVLHSGMILSELNLYTEEIRRQRNNSIQTELQYLWVHMIALNYFQKQLLIDETRLPYLEAFRKEYATKVI